MVNHVELVNVVGVKKGVRWLPEMMVLRRNKYIRVVCRGFNNDR